MSLYIHLYHGRKDPDKDMEDWGTEGPFLGPFTSVGIVYKDEITLWQGNEMHFLTFHQDMVHYDGTYYGDVSIISAETLNKLNKEVEEFDAKKFEIKEEVKTS